MADPSRQAVNWAVACHLAPLLGYYFCMPFLGLLVPYLIWYFQRSRYPFVEKNAREVFNFQLSIFLYSITASALLYALATHSSEDIRIWVTESLPLAQIGLAAYSGLALILTVCGLIGAVQASRREIFWYPLNMRLIK